jgi:hypothetical protein
MEVNMNIAFLVIVVVAVLALAGLFGLGSVSQSYASARQAQAAIEASQTAQMAVAGNLVVIVILGLLVVVLGAIVAVLVLRNRPALAAQPAGRKTWASGPNALWGQEPSAALPDPPDPQTLLLSMMAYQMMQQFQHPPQTQAQFPALAEPEEDWSAAWQDTWS